MKATMLWATITLLALGIPVASASHVTSNINEVCYELGQHQTIFACHYGGPDDRHPNVPGTIQYVKDTAYALVVFVKDTASGTYEETCAEVNGSQTIFRINCRPLPWERVDQAVGAVVWAVGYVKDTASGTYEETCAEVNNSQNVFAVYCRGLP